MDGVKAQCACSLGTTPTKLTRNWTQNLSHWKILIFSTEETLYKDMQEHLLTSEPIWVVTQNERVVDSKNNSEGKFAARKCKGSGKTEQINVDLDNLFW